ncbi:MAG: DUF2061 domain-containing protein [Flavobacteriales bacterium]|nr:DUF2061 domain-containing protein [Flavobacteriales bacterium]
MSRILVHAQKVTSIAIAENILKMEFYYFHERVWCRY